MITRTSHDRRPDVLAVRRGLIELLALEREISELEYVRRADALERVADAVRRLAEVGSTDGILGRAAAELGASSRFDRVLISEVVDRALAPLAIWDRTDQAGADRSLEDLRGSAIALEYPLIEAEVVRTHRAEIVTLDRGAGRAARPLAQALGWSSYVVVALTAQGESIGLLHADTAAGSRPLEPLDAEVMATYAEGLAGVCERAVLRHTLELHRAELQSAAQWMGGRLSRLSEAATLHGPRPSGDAQRRLVESLTPRELEVLRLLARGQTNLAIADALVIREGTVKYHVKNILRKLSATSRTDAVSRFVRSSAPEGTR